MRISEYENFQETKQHSDTLFPFNTYPCSIPLDFSDVPIHWHNEMEIIYIKKGKGTVILDFESHYVESGDIIVVIPGQTHGISQLKPYSMEYENIIFNTDMLIAKYSDGVDTSYFIPLLTGNVLFNHIISKDEPHYANIAGCLDRADRLCSHNFPKGYEMAIKGYLFEFFYELYGITDEYTGEKTDSSKNLDKIKEVIKYTEKNYRKPISIDEIAAVCNFSSSHFMKYFKKIMGTSFIDYLNDYRLSMASRLLLSSSDSILEIAAECGYENLSYFNRLFKKKYGLTPSAYRSRQFIS
ncbi:MAG: helix-turn-helix domain-containing protein [Butyrivibrio sp.]